MGNYQCKKCDIPLNYYYNNTQAQKYNCRIHNFSNNECKDCYGSIYNNRYVNCKHKFKFYFCCIK